MFSKFKLNDIAKRDANNKIIVNILNIILCFLIIFNPLNKFFFPMLFLIISSLFLFGLSLTKLILPYSILIITLAISS